MTVLVRIFAAVAAGLVAKLALMLEANFGVLLTPDDQDWLVAAFVAGATALANWAIRVFMRWWKTREN